LQGKLVEFKIGQYFPYEHDSDVGKETALAAVLEYMDKHKLENLEGSTSIYIIPGYSFRICSGIITNFHQPKSTLLLLISALIGDKWKTVYQEAMNRDYRFLSFGDSSLLLVE
jgi:S-adenosylmethionine:tRNA ribosyltransferase-isomerase